MMTFSIEAGHSFLQILVFLLLEQLVSLIAKKHLALMRHPSPHKKGIHAIKLFSTTKTYKKITYAHYGVPIRARKVVLGCHIENAKF